MSGASRRAPSASLLAGRRALDSLRNVAILKDWVWAEGPGVPEERWPLGAWALHCALRMDIASGGPIPPITEWYLLADPRYPLGEIKLYPAKSGGIEQTFQHQDYNFRGHADAAWRQGAPCLDTMVRVLGLHGGDEEPEDADERLVWHCRRASGWLDLASRGELAARGDWFELPAFPAASGDIQVVFSEGVESFSMWQSVSERVGLVDFSLSLRGKGLLVAREFRSLSGRSLLRPSWGRSIVATPINPRVGVWVRLDEVPTLSAWGAPYLWRELRRVWSQQRLSINQLLRPVAARLRDGRAHVALIGFPIPARVGGAPVLMHWQAVQLPVLTGPNRNLPRRGRWDASRRWPVPRDLAVPRGFRPGETAYWQRDMIDVLNGDNVVEWLKSENWHPDQISTRGRFSKPLRSSRVLLLGAGAVGSTVGEFLVRAGVYQVTVIDGDDFEVGNLVRHTLTLDDVGISKAAALARRLNLLSPHTQVDAIDSTFPPLSDEAQAKVQQCHIILNCTADREVLHHLEAFPWESPKLFACLSVGRGSTRLYSFTAHGSSFPRQAFDDMLAPWAAVPVPEPDDAGDEQDDGQSADELPWAGVGCWHPVFPARADDIALMASVGVKCLHGVVSRGKAEPALAVFEYQREAGAFSGVKQVELVVACV